MFSPKSDGNIGDLLSPDKTAHISWAQVYICPCAGMCNLAVSASGKASHQQLQLQRADAGGGAVAI
jgi:hypothetical protein